MNKETSATSGCRNRDLVSMLRANYVYRLIQRVMKRMLLLLCVLFLSACQYDPFAGRLTTSKPESSNLVGTYVLDAVFLPSKIGKPPLEITIKLRADGTFAATNIPPNGGEPNDDFYSKLVSGSGQWEVANVGAVDNGSGDQTVWGIDLHGSGWSIDAQCTGNHAPYGLIFQFGDPDEGYAMLLKRL